MDFWNFFSSFLGATLAGLVIPAIIWYLTDFRTKLRDEWADNSMSGILCQSPMEIKHRMYKHKYGVFSTCRLMLQRAVLWSFRVPLGKASVNYLRRLHVEKLAHKITG